MFLSLKKKKKKKTQIELAGELVQFYQFGQIFNL